MFENRDHGFKADRIYVTHESKNPKIFWVGEIHEDKGYFCDKQYTGQMYYFSDTFGTEISFRDAIKRDLIEYRRFTLMHGNDKIETVKIMLEEKGIKFTLNFLSDTDLNLSDEWLKNVLIKLN